MVSTTFEQTPEEFQNRLIDMIDTIVDAFEKKEIVFVSTDYIHDGIIKFDITIKKSKPLLDKENV